MTKEEWIKIYHAKDGTWDKDDLIDKAYEIMTSPIRTNYDRIKQMNIEEMAEFIVKIKMIFSEDIYIHIQEEIKDYIIKIDNKKIKKWKRKERKFYKKWLEQEVE